MRELSDHAAPGDHSPLVRRDFLVAAAALGAGGLTCLSPAAGGESGGGADADRQTVDLRVFQTRRIAESDVLPPDRTALVIIDMINRFCDPQWMSGGSAEGAKKVASDLAAMTPPIQRVLRAFRRAGGLVVHVVNARWTRDGREVVKYQRGRDYDLFDSPAMSVIDALRPEPGEIVTRKVASSAFTGTGLDFLLRNAGVENVVLCGQFGNACVFYSLIQSREYGFTNYWLEDGMLYGGDVYRRVFEALVGSMWARLATSADVERALRPATGEK